jgi:hypothetical protein
VSGCWVSSTLWTSAPSPLIDDRRDSGNDDRIAMQCAVVLRGVSAEDGAAGVCDEESKESIGVKCGGRWPAELMMFLAVTQRGWQGSLRDIVFSGVLSSGALNSATADGPRTYVPPKTAQALSTVNNHSSPTRRQHPPAKALRYFSSSAVLSYEERGRSISPKRLEIPPCPDQS